MKQIIIISALTMLSVFSCKKSEESKTYELSGTYVGLDEALCACCGGYKIAVDGDSSEYQFFDLSEDINLDLDNPPIDIKFDWTLITNCSGINHIEIDALEVQ